MPRNISFALTTDQIRNRTKTVTRRLGWKHLKAGDVLNACVKCMGLKPGEKIERLGQIRVVDVRQEPLALINSGGWLAGIEAAREGFPEMDGSEFVKMFCKHMKCDPQTVVTRIEFEYMEEPKVTLQELAKLVDRMRVVQRAYFRTRKPDVLEESKRLEREVDEVIKSILNTQPELF